MPVHQRGYGLGCGGGIGLFLVFGVVVGFFYDISPVLGWIAIIGMTLATIKLLASRAKRIDAQNEAARTVIVRVETEPPTGRHAKR